MAAGLDASSFERLMARFEPFEPAPVLGVGVSGGPDSMALVLLTADWAKARGGRVLALIVDHGLRPESSAEARQVATWLGRRGIAHAVLAWSGPKPATGLQAAARAARHRLLGDRCRSEGILHLLLAHHRGDQAETVALRAEDASGPDGLAAMAAETATDWGRVLRPLLTQPKSALAAVLAAAGQDWIEDPTNRDERQARARLRRRIAEDGSEAALAAGARIRGLERAARDRAVAMRLARHVALMPAGWARIEVGLIAPPDDLAAAALARVVAAIGDRDYPPRRDRLGRLLAALREAPRRARTLGGCRLIPSGDTWIVAREPASLPPAVPVAGSRTAWDRFVLCCQAGMPAGVTLGALGPSPVPRATVSVPAAARPGLPALRDLDGIAAVPHVAWVRPEAEMRLRGATAWTFPRRALAPAEFAVA